MSKEVREYIYNELIEGIQEIKRESEKIERTLIERRDKGEIDPDQEGRIGLLPKKALEVFSSLTAFRTLNK